MAAARAYPSDVKEDEWAFVSPYLALMQEDAPQRQYPLRALFNALRYLAHTGCPWRYLPHDLPPWQPVYQPWVRWRDARVFESIVHDLQRLLLGRPPTPTAIVLDGRTLQSTLESGHGAGYDGAKKRTGRKAHIAVYTLGHVLSVVITPANEQERAQVGELCRQVQEATGQTVQVGFLPGSAASGGWGATTNASAQHYSSFILSCSLASCLPATPQVHNRLIAGKSCSNSLKRRVPGNN